MIRDESFGSPSEQRITKEESTEETSQFPSLKKSLLVYASYLIGFSLLTAGTAALVNDSFGYKVSVSGVEAVFLLIIPAIKLFRKWWARLGVSVLAVNVNGFMMVLAWMRITNNGQIDYSEASVFLSLLAIAWIFCASEVTALIVRRVSGTSFEVILKD